MDFRVGIKQFSAHWSSLEDRIFFSFNTEEGELFQFWLTRAMSQFLLDRSQLTVEQELSIQHSERSSKLISEFQKEGLKKQIHFDETFEGGQTTPLGDDPILVVAINLELAKEGVQVALTLASNQVVRFPLTSTQLQALILLVERLASQAQWKLAEEEVIIIDAGQSILNNPPTQLH